jgi:hypothetical protein
MAVAAPQAGAGDMPTYTPPAGVGKPATSTGGGSRSAPDSLKITGLAPVDQFAYAFTAQPTLYWLLSKSSSEPVELVIAVENPKTNEDAIPLLEKKLPADKAGVHSLSLANEKVQLKEDVGYIWSVNSGAQIFGTGFIKYKPASAADIAGCLAGKPDKLAAYASCGGWYDALHEISTQIAAHPADANLKNVRNSLLGQIGMPALNE